MEILDKLAEILELDNIKVEDELDDFDLWDSLTILSIIAMLDEDYSVNIDGDKLAEFKTVQEIVDLTL
jgi:acyl carrier protein